MQYKTTLHYDIKLIQKAIFNFWRRTVGIVYFVILTLLILLLARNYQDANPWVFATITMFVFLGFALPLLLFVVHYKNSVKKFKSMSGKQAIFQAGQDTFSLESSIGVVTLSWSVIQEVWVYSDFWLIFFNKAQFNILPVKDIPPQMQTYVLERISHAQGKVR